jgi:hypothetical protein
LHERRGALFYLVIALGPLWRIFLGYVPLPADLVTNYPLWGTFQMPFVQRYHGVMEDLARSFLPVAQADRGGGAGRHHPAVEPRRAERLPDARRQRRRDLRAADDARLRPAD